MNSIEGYRHIVILLGGLSVLAGLVYFPIGLVMAVIPDRWSDYAYLALRGTRQRAKTAGMTDTARVLLRILGFCFSVLSILIFWSVAKTIFDIRMEGLAI